MGFAIPYSLSSIHCPMIKLEVLTQDLEHALKELAQRVSDMRPALQQIGEDLVHSTKQRFETGIGPDGVPWEPNKPATLAKYTHRVQGTMTKDRKLLTKLGERRWDSKKPLTDQGTLGEQIDYDLIGPDTVFIYSNREYAAMQQFGGKKSEFPHLWGDIPPRPFLGLSEDDQTAIERICRKHLQP